MSSPYPWYFVIDGRPIKVVEKDGGADVLALDPATGAMVSAPQVERAAYMKLLDRLRQPILEGYATAALRWESTGDNEEPYRLAVGGHELTIRLGAFPDEAMYLLHIDGQGVYAIDDWPAAWKKPGTCTRNLCSNDGWVVDSRTLASDPSDHDAPILPKLGCTNLMCGLCYQKVRSVGGVIPREVHGGIDTRALFEDLGASTLLVPSTQFRLYVCHCAYHLEGGERPLDDKEGVQVATQWTCVGHPIAELPHVFDGVSVTADNLAGVVARALANELPADLRESDQRDGVWAARLAIRLEGTPHQEPVVAAAAAHLTHPDARIRSRAVQFFVNAPHFANHMHADVLLGQHPELFVDVPNPLGVMNFERTLEFLVWRVSGSEFPVNPALRELAHSFALDPKRSSKVLFIALVQNDAAWFADNAARLSAANPERTNELLRAVDGSGLPASVAAAIKNAAGA